MTDQATNTTNASGATLERPSRRGGHELTNALAKALGLPRNTTRAVLTLEAGKHPLLDLTMHALDKAGRPIVEEVPGEYGEGVERRIAQVHFMVRLESFPDASAERST